MKLTCKEGHNLFMPQFPVRPFFGGSELNFKIQLGTEWWNGDLTYPATSYGMKFAIGKCNYHKGGISFGFIYIEGKMYAYPRYYESIKSGTYKPHELDQYKIEIDGGWHEGLIIANGLQWWWDGVLLHSISDVKVSHGWYASPFIGRSGKDTGYDVNNPPAYAARLLTIQLKLL